jgi:hypothetical protein
MSQQWLRDDNSDRWACFLVFDNRIDVLAVLSPHKLIDRTMTRDNARKLWSDLVADGWRHVSNDELDQQQMSYRRLRYLAYGR